MKSGAGDDPFADDNESDTQENVTETTAEPTSPDDQDTEPLTGGRQINQTASTTELPYKYRRDSVKDGRSQQPMFLQDSTEGLIKDTVAEIEAQFDEDVYKTDVVEAMIVAGGEEATPAAVLQRWGYGMKNR